MRGWVAKDEIQVLIQSQDSRTLESDSLTACKLVSLLVSARVSACSRKRLADWKIEYESKTGCCDPFEVWATSRHGLQPDSHCLVSGGCVGRCYVQTRRYRTTRDRWQGNNSKVIRHMGKNIAGHKRTKHNKIKGTDKGVIWCTGMWLKNFTFIPADQQQLWMTI